MASGTSGLGEIREREMGKERGNPGQENGKGKWEMGKEKGNGKWERKRKRGNRKGKGKWEMGKGSGKERRKEGRENGKGGKENRKGKEKRKKKRKRKFAPLGRKILIPKPASLSKAVDFPAGRSLSSQRPLPLPGVPEVFVIPGKGSESLGDEIWGSWSHHSPEPAQPELLIQFPPSQIPPLPPLAPSLGGNEEFGAEPRMDGEGGNLGFVLGIPREDHSWKCPRPGLTRDMENVAQAQL